MVELQGGNQLKIIMVTKDLSSRCNLMKVSNFDSVVIIYSRLYFPMFQVSVFRADRFKACSVVGSSGVLTGSKCGAEIDKADFVFRYWSV